jgi:hypothetical protein
MASVFKIRDKLSGTFWNGDMRWSKFDDKGKQFRSRSAAEQAVARVFKYHESFPSVKVKISTENWEVVEYAVSYTEAGTHDIKEYMNYCKLKAEISYIDHMCGWFMETMYRKVHVDKIQYLFKLKASEDRYGYRHISFDTIKEGRAHLRQLGVKTRSFKEARGVFGMLDREQAMRARLTLEVDTVIDVSEIRQRLGI